MGFRIGMNMALAGGGGRAPSPNFNFATDGFAVPFWPNAGPAGVYSSRTGKLWMIEEGSYVRHSDGQLIRRFHARTRDMVTGEISPICFIGDVPSATDYHGPAAPLELPAPATGHFLTVGGAHQTPFKAWVTQTPDEPAGWRPLADIGTSRTYARLVSNGTNVILFCSHSELAVSFRSLGYQVSTNIAADGEITWGSLVAITNPLDGRSYSGVPAVDPGDPTKIHFTWLLGNLDDSQRVHVYYGILDLTDGSVSNFDGSVITAAASLPMADALMDASYRIFTQNAAGGANTCIPALHFDADGDVHIAWSDGIEPNLMAKHSIWNGSAWVTTNLGAMAGRYDQACVQDGPAGGVLLLWQATVGSKKEVRGKVRTAAGVFGDEFLVWRGERAQGIGGAVAIVPSHADAVMALHETPLDPVDTAEDGTLRSRVVKADGTFLPWIKTSYNWVNAEAEAYDQRRVVPLASVHESLPYYIDRWFTARKEIGLAKWESWHILGLSALDNTDPLEDLLNADRRLIKVNNPPFTPYRGFGGNAVDQRLDAPVNLSASAIYLQNNAHVSVGTLGVPVPGGSHGVAVGSVGGANVYIFLTDGVNCGCRINGTSGTISFANTSGSRSVVLCRSGVNALAVSSEGVQRATSTTVSTGVPTTPMRINNANSAGVHGDYDVFNASWGANLIADEIEHDYFSGELPLRRLMAS